jgi:hypothetical protein
VRGHRRFRGTLVAMDMPTAETIRRHARPFDFARIGYPAPGEGSADDDPLSPRVRSALSYVLGMTCRTVGSVPDELEDALLDAVVMRVQQQALGGDLRRIREVALGGGIKSFRAGDYQETRFTAAENRAHGERDVTRINPWEDLAELLLLLAVGECRDRLLDQIEAGIGPAIAIVELNHGAGDGYSPYGF